MSEPSSCRCGVPRGDGAKYVYLVRDGRDALTQQEETQAILIEQLSATGEQKREVNRVLRAREGEHYEVLQLTADVTTRDHASPSAPIVWYLIETHASKGDEVATTRVHRRFRDFADLDEAVNGALAGHHVRNSVPRLPQKKLKLFQDHNDAAFLEARRRDLDGYVAKLVHVPHVWATPPAAPFVGVANNVREYSVVFPERTLGFTLGKSSGAESRENDFPAFVASCRPPDCPVDVRIGDLLSKISGRSVATMTFAELLCRGHLDRCYCVRRMCVVLVLEGIMIALAQRIPPTKENASKP